MTGASGPRAAPRRRPLPGRALVEAARGLRDRLVAAPDPPAGRPRSAGVALGRSREGRPLVGHRFGAGPVRVSLLAGCHADEPVGPRLLRRLVGLLAALPDDDPLLAGCEWWILPHINPDGEARNRAWQPRGAAAYELAAYGAHAAREPPGDDVEFGFPRDDGDGDARPENRAAWEWWRSAGGPFDLHASLHGMAVASGPWFLVEGAWRERRAVLERRCRDRVAALGHVLHDVDRRGEKGFHRLGPGFSTRPDSRAMREHFLRRGDPATAARFRPSSMEAVRRLGGDPLTLVPEVPLFVTPGTGGGGTGEDGGEPEPRPIPARDQMDLQWTFVAAGLEQLRAARLAAAGGP